MFFYRLGSFVLQSSVPFPELSVARSHKVDLVFRPGSPPNTNTPPIHRVLIHDGKPWLRVERNEAGYCISFPTVADFVISPDLKHIGWIAAASLPLETVRHLFLDQVFPMLMSGWGKFVLHASAVELHGAAVGFTGRSGMGKSTLAAAFAKEGYEVISDDALILEPTVEGITGQRTYASLRLWPPTLRALFGAGASSSRVAHYTKKQRVHFKQSTETSIVPLRRLYALGTCDSGIAITSLSATEALMELIRSTFRLDITNRHRLSQELDVYGALARGGFVRLLLYPRDLRRLSEVKQAILADLKDGSRLPPWP